LRFAFYESLQAQMVDIKFGMNLKMNSVNFSTFFL
jgi:hypothetical protein